MTDIRERLESLWADLFIKGYEMPMPPPEFLAALEADGLTITETETARVGEAVLRLRDRQHVIERDDDGWYNVSVEGGQGRATDIDAAIEEALR